MKITVKDDFDLNTIAESGQCFRFNLKDNGDYRIIAFKRVLRIRQSETNVFELDCSEEDYKNIWYDYFDLSTNYSLIRESVKDNAFLCECAKASRGMRILNQDKWEMIISFIISQRKSIPAIKTSIERLSQKLGDKIGDDLYAFPSAKQILDADENTLNECGLGYRLSYIREAADLLYSNEREFERLNKLNDEDLLSELKKMQGVGDKVASCIALFGFHRLNFFPKDVWINRALSQHFPAGFDMEKYSPYNGVIQQYIFYAYRKSHKQMTQ